MNNIVIEIDKLEIDKEKMGKKLTHLRGAKTQKDVSNAIGISESALAMYEAGKRAPRDEIKLRLAQYYHTGLVELFYNLKVHDL